MTKLSVLLSISVVLMMALMMSGIALAEEEDEEVYFITMPDGGVAPSEYGQRYTVTIRNLSVEDVSVYGYMAKACEIRKVDYKLAEVLKNLYYYGQAASGYVKR